MKEEKALPGAVLFGLLALLGIISVAVHASTPRPQTPDQERSHLVSDEVVMYFFDAEIMAKQVCPATSLRWSHVVLDPQSGCGPVGNGIWYAMGTVEDPTAVPPPRRKWEALFKPEGRVPLFVRVGGLVSGDAKAALKMAGYSDITIEGIPFEK